MSGFPEVFQLVKEQGTAFDEFKTSYASRLSDLEDAYCKLTSPGMGTMGSGLSRENAERMGAFMNYMRSGRESELQQKSMSSGTDPEGGYLVPSQIDRELTKHLRALSPMRRLARVVNVGTAEFKQPAATGRAGYAWVGEKQDRDETPGPGFKMLSVPTHEIYAMPKITQALLDDNDFNLEAWLIDELTETFGDGESDAFINGDGIIRPRGLFTYDVVATPDATRAHDKFQYVPTGGAGALASSDPCDALISLVYSVKARYRTNASWLISPELLEVVRKLKNPTTDEYIFQPSLQAGQPATLLGYPIEEDENIPAIGANSLSAAFGDFNRAYTITDRSTAMLRDPYTAKPYVKFYTTKRVGGGGGRDTRAVKFLKFSAS